jgi:hypothetical protein
LFIAQLYNCRIIKIDLKILDLVKPNNLIQVLQQPKQPHHQLQKEKNQQNKLRKKKRRALSKKHLDFKQGLIRYMIMPKIYRKSRKIQKKERLNLDSYPIFIHRLRDY